MSERNARNQSFGSNDNERPDTPEDIAADVAAMEAFEAMDITFMNEDEQSDDPISVRKWIDDLRSIPPVPETPAQEASRVAWEVRMRSFNIAAVRKQFGEGTP